MGGVWSWHNVSVNAYMYAVHTGYEISGLGACSRSYHQVSRVPVAYQKDSTTRPPPSPPPQRRRIGFQFCVLRHVVPLQSASKSDTLDPNKADSPMRSDRNLPARSPQARRKVPATSPQVSRRSDRRLENQRWIQGLKAVPKLSRMLYE